MNKPMRLAEFSAAKPRTGLRSFSELLDTLIRIYEKQNEVEERFNRIGHPPESLMVPQGSESSLPRPGRTPGPLTGATEGVRFSSQMVAANQLVEPAYSKPSGPIFVLETAPQRQTTFSFYDSCVG